MMYRFNVNTALAVLVLLAFLSCNDQKKESDKELTNSTVLDPVFVKLSPEQTGVRFANYIEEDLNTLENLFNFDYFYNGAGVGIEDINNDGLQDIFFTANQQPNRLFLNKGNLEFEDISTSAGINQGKQWSNGVAFVDINQDGWMDIYVSQGGPNQRLQRKNLLYINQKDNTFQEMAEEYGLADMGISTQSAFFDYDRDGDLDCIVMNENEYYGVDPINLYTLIGENQERKYFNSSHLYRNEGGAFKNVSKEAGIEKPIFGLGLTVTDINKDGWMDFYIASDYYIPDALYINQKDGTFTDEIKSYTNQVSFYGMGMDIADINNDGLQDIFVLDMASSDHFRSKTLMASMNVPRFNYLTKTAGFQHQYMYNSLQLNQGNNHFSNIAQLTGTASTDWSWSVLMSDFDLDADRDIYITNGYRRYALDNDLQGRVLKAKQQYNNQVPLQVKEELYQSMPSEKLANLLFENKNTLEFEENGKDWGLGDLTFSNGAALGDLDNDGDVDLVVSNMDENAFIYQNTSAEQKRGNYLNVRAKGELSESFAKLTLFYDQGQKQFAEVKRIRGYRSSQSPMAFFGLGQTQEVDSLLIEWPEGKYQLIKGLKTNQELIVNSSDAIAGLYPYSKVQTSFSPATPSILGLDYVHQENSFDDFEKEILLPYKQSQVGPKITKGDVNGDGLTDLFIGGASGQAGALYLQKNQRFHKVVSPAFETDNVYDDADATFFDLDGDKDLDLYVVSGGNAFPNGSSLYQDRIYINDGAGNFTRASEVNPPNSFSGNVVIPFDFDGDKDMDIVLGNRIIPQNYPRHAPSALYSNDNGVLVDVTAERIPELKDFGIVNDLIASDFDQDGLTDLIAVGEWTAPGFFRNTGSTFELMANPVEDSSMKGWWFSVTEIDGNKDGLPDYILGNVGANIKFSASEEKPFKIFATDFDQNGTHDIVLSKKYNGEYVPVRGRECSSQQMPFIKEKFPSYSEFASASLEEVYGEELGESYSREVNTFESYLLQNNGNGTFTAIPLAIEAQLFPILDVVSTDINKDGIPDVILGGNIYETEVETPRLDALSGLVMLGDGKGGFQPLSYTQSGLYLKGNIKSIENLKIAGKNWLLAGANGKELILYEHP